MEPEIERIGEFAWSVLTNWLLLLGGLLMTAIGVLERVFKRHVHWRVYIGVLCALLISAFYVSWRNVTMQLEARPIAVAPPIKIDVLDMEGRREIASLKRELEAANAKIQKQRLEVDPRDKPLVSARFSVVINFQKRGVTERFGHYPGACALLGLVSGEEHILVAESMDHFSDGKGESKFVADCPFDAAFMGKPVKALAATTFIQVEFVDAFIPVGSQITEGQIVLLLNSEVVLRFRIPSQTLTTKESNNQTLMVLRDVQEGLKPLLKP